MISIMEEPTLQNKVKRFTEEYNLTCNSEVRYIDLVSEVGELGKELLKGTDYGKKSFQIREALKMKLEIVCFHY